MFVLCCEYPVVSKTKWNPYALCMNTLHTTPGMSDVGMCCLIAYGILGHTSEL